MEVMRKNFIIKVAAIDSLSVLTDTPDRLVEGIVESMERMNNASLLRSALKAIYAVASRRTSAKFAEETLGSTIRALETKYDFLQYVRIEKDHASAKELAIHVSDQIDTVHPSRIGKAIEAIIRVVYNDLNEQAGLYFITELKEFTGEKIAKEISDCNIDLDQVQVEQHYAYRRRKKKESIAKGLKDGEQTENLIGYTWNKVGKWSHEAGSKFCTLYDKEGKVLDRLDLDKIIQNYVECLSGYEEKDPQNIEKETRIYEKEYNLLKLMLEQDMDAETAMQMLRISEKELNEMIRKLSSMEMLHYVDYNTIELTDMGVNYIAEKEKK